MSATAARANMALQLGMDAAKIDGYQDDATSSAAPVADNARTTARFTAEALQNGVTLAVADQLAANTATPGDLSGLTYVDANNYFYRTSSSLAKAAGVAGSSFSETITRVSRWQKYHRDSIALPPRLPGASGLDSLRCHHSAHQHFGQPQPQRLLLVVRLGGLFDRGACVGSIHVQRVERFV